MSELNQGELLKDLEFVLATWKRHYPHKLPPMRILRIFENFKQIKEMIKKPEVTEEWIEEQARKMGNLIIPFHTTKSITNFMADPLERCKDFIRSLVEEIYGKKRVAEDWIEGEDYEDYPRKKK